MQKKTRLIIVLAIVLMALAIALPGVILDAPTPAHACDPVCEEVTPTPTPELPPDGNCQGGGHCGD
jgi:hypothetical protein